MAKRNNKLRKFFLLLCFGHPSLRFAVSSLSADQKMTEEEVAMEMEAVEAVYGDEAVIVDSYPPHLHLHIKPRTAEISSQQVLLLLKIETLRIGDSQISVFGFFGVLGRS